MPPKTLVWNEDQLIVLLKLTMKHQAFMVTEGDSLTNKFHRVHRDCLKNPLFEGLIMPQPETLHGKVERLLKDVERIFFEERINLSGLDKQSSDSLFPKQVFSSSNESLTLKKPTQASKYMP